MARSVGTPLAMTSSVDGASTIAGSVNTALPMTGSVGGVGRALTLVGSVGTALSMTTVAEAGINGWCWIVDVTTRTGYQSAMSCLLP